jgi:hypothetical protein
MADLPVDSTSDTPTRLPAAPVAAGCALLAATACVAAFDPSERGVFAPCPFRMLTGWWCPGCGMTRATHRLLHGDVIGALRLNALLPFVLTAIALLWIDWYRRSIASRPWLPSSVPRWATAAAIVAATGFAALRNVPGVDGLRG